MTIAKLLIHYHGGSNGVFPLKPISIDEFDTLKDIITNEMMIEGCSTQPMQVFCSSVEKPSALPDECPWPVGHDQKIVHIDAGVPLINYMRKGENFVCVCFMPCPSGKPSKEYWAGKEVQVPVFAEAAVKSIAGRCIKSAYPLHL